MRRLKAFGIWWPWPCWLFGHDFDYCQDRDIVCCWGCGKVGRFFTRFRREDVA